MTSDSWQTPQWLYDELNEEFNFDIDLCATKENSKCERFYDDYLKGIFYKKEYDSHLKLNWEGPYINSDYSNIMSERYPGLTCFMNPPYSNPKPFIEKAWEESKHCLIVCLVKVDSSTKWWSIFYDANKFEERPGCKIRLLPKRIKFDPPTGWEGKSTGPSFPSAVLIFDRRNK